MVLGICLLVTIAGISAATVGRVNTVASAGLVDAAVAELAACSAVELGVTTVAINADWRSRYQNDAEAGRFTLGRATCSWKLVDPKDGLLNNAADDPVALIATATVGRASQTAQVTLIPDPVPLDCLRVGLHSGGNMTFTSANVTCSQTISSNASIIASGGSTITGQIESVQARSGGTFTDATPTLIQPRSMPATNAFDYYIANGTAIAYSSLPKSGANGLLQGVVLSPAQNPFGGATNPRGIYVINCGGQPMLIKNIRVVGTLVLLNLGGGSNMQQSMLFEPAVANYPSLLVQGDLSLGINTSKLAESAGVNFNPPGTPYLGAADTDYADTYPSEIRGLVYVSGSLSTTNHPVIDGCLVVGGTVSSNSDLEVTYRTTFAENPPPGFLLPAKMKMSSRTWRRVVR
jgi:hypothetical protein